MKVVVDAHLVGYARLEQSTSFRSAGQLGSCCGRSEKKSLELFSVMYFHGRGQGCVGVLEFSVITCSCVCWALRTWNWSCAWGKESRTWGRVVLSAITMELIVVEQAGSTWLENPQATSGFVAVDLGWLYFVVYVPCFCVQVPTH